ncbi:hypothetical protein Tco_1430584 [Tanacetum coccineum]
MQMENRMMKGKGSFQPTDLTPLALRVYASNRGAMFVIDPMVNNQGRQYSEDRVGKAVNAWTRLTHYEATTAKESGT